MIGSSVVPGLPNRCVMPSADSSFRNAARPVTVWAEGRFRSICVLCDDQGSGACTKPAGLRSATRAFNAKDAENIETQKYGSAFHPGHCVTRIQRLPSAGFPL